MGNIGTSLILLILALVLLWLAVTDKLDRVLSAWDVITGKTPTVAAAGGTPFAPATFRLPSLPTLGNNAQVPAV